MSTKRIIELVHGFEIFKKYEDIEITTDEEWIYADYADEISENDRIELVHAGWIEWDLFFKFYTGDRSL